MREDVGRILQKLAALAPHEPSKTSLPLPAVLCTSGRWFQVVEVAFSLFIRGQAVQNHMLARLLQTNRLPGEDTDCYFRRRRVICRRLSAKMGRWSDSWARAVCTWVGHVQRGHDPGAWTTVLYDWHASEWLQRQRVSASRGGSARRLGTRAGPGRPATRFFEGAEIALIAR